eukprot:494940_1
MATTPDINALQQELLKYKNENEELRTLLKEKTTTLNNTILIKSEQTKQQQIKLQQEIEQYNKTKSLYQTIIDEHKSFKTQINTLTNQLTQSENTINEHALQLSTQTQLFIQKENKYKNDIIKLNQQIIDNNNNYKQQIKQLNNKNNQSEMDKNDLISLIVTRMSQQKEEGKHTQLMSCNNVLSSTMTFTELQARFSELMLAFQKEYNSHKNTQLQLKQLKCQKDLKHMEIDAVKNELLELNNNYHNIINKCNKYQSIYGDINNNNNNNENIQTQLTLKHKLEDSINQLNTYKHKLQLTENNKNKQIEYVNKELQIKIDHLQSDCNDKNKTIQRYKNMNETLTNALHNLQSNINATQTNNENDSIKGNININTNDNINGKSNENGNDESELELCQRMYNDKILQLQKTMDKCNEEKNIIIGKKKNIGRAHVLTPVT